MMENIEKKLNTNNPALVSQVFSRLIQVASSSTNVQQEFQFLKAKCLGSNSVVSDVATMSILHLVENKVLETDQVLTEFVTSISTTASNVTSLTKMIISLLQLKYGTALPISEQSVNIRPYKLTQHPLIKILQEELHYDLQSCIFNEIVRTCSSVKLSQALRLQIMYEPIYLYCLDSPKAKLELGFLKYKLWSFLLKFDENNRTNCIFLPCCWLQIQFKNAELASDLLNEVLQNQLQSVQCYKSLDYLILVQMLVIHNMVLNYSDIRVSVGIVLKVLQERKSTFNHHNAALLIFAKTVLIASPKHLEQLLELCLYLSTDNRCKPYSFLALKTALLYWLANPSHLTKNASVTAHKILALNDRIFRNRPQIMASRVTIDKYNSMLFCNPELLFYVELAIKMECINTNEIQVMVNHLEQAPMTFLNQVFTYMCGLMLDPTLESGLKIRVLGLVVKCGCDFNQNYLPVLMSVLLYLLSNSEDSNLHLELLKALPLTVKVKENVPKVVATLLAISKRSTVLNNLAMRLLYDTWQIDNSCYSTLETFFPLPSNITKVEVIERNITRAYVFNKLSEQRPELYGKDLVAHLSNILNECTTSYNAIAASLAIEGIRHLCKAEIIDVVTTWATLSPKFKGDNRSPVIKSLCKLIGDIPNLEYTESYDKLYDEVTQYLWNYIVNSESKEVIAEALDALSSFSLDWICAHIPKQYLDEGSSNQGEKRVLPGKTWIKFLESNKSPETVCSFLSKLVSKEVNNYLKYVYQLKSQREPENYGGLPSHSVVRALEEYLKRNFLKINKWDSPKQEQLFLHCLKVFSIKYSKPLPPLDWCFLQEVIHEPSFKGYCLDLASHQAILSGSARRLVENYILAITDNPKVEDSIHIYRNLLYLANSIQPIVIKPFLVNTLQLFLVETTKTLENSLMHLRIVLDEKDVQEVNKTVIEEVLTDLVALSDTNSKVFVALLSCLPSFSQNGQEKVARFTSEKINQQDFIKITKIRCHLAVNAGENPLKWLHDIINIAYKNAFPLDLYYNEFTSTLKKHQNHKDSPHWLNDLLGEIQLKVADQCDNQEIEHYCEILTISVVHFSGLYFILPKYGHSNNKYVFTAALKLLLEEPMWSVSVTQILEWLHYMNLSDSITETYRRIFGWTLCGLRHEDEFAKSSRWLRFLDSTVCIKNVL